MPSLLSQGVPLLACLKLNGFKREMLELETLSKVVANLVSDLLSELN